MTQKELEQLLAELLQLTNETEWVEFKVDYYHPHETGEYISALANSACLHNKPKGYLIFGIKNKTHNVVGTNFKPRQTKIGNEELENWVIRLLNPRIDFVIREFEFNNIPTVLLEIDAADNVPVKFKGTAYIRVGSYKKKLSDYPAKERKIWRKKADYDWSAQICDDATLNDLDPEAIKKARKEFKQKEPELADEVDDWDDIKFLNKAKVTINNKITNTAIILLGKSESEHFVSPSVVRITWVLKDEQNFEKDYTHFDPPFIINVEKVFARVRNLNYRFLPDRTLFPIEVTQYDPWVIREALHNCIAHQDYELHSKINVIEKTDELIFSNVGSFIPGSVETVIQQDAPPEFYRNSFLATAMVNLNMIDTIGGGIRKMFQFQKQRYFPMPDYDLTQPKRVIVSIHGKILDENYTHLLIENADMELNTAILLDKVQKRTRLSKDEHKSLKSKKLVEGRYPNLFVSSHIAAVAGEKARYIKYKGFDKRYYQDLIVSFIKKHGSASRGEINDLILDKLPEVLTEKQKIQKIHNLLTEMSRKLGIIENIGSYRYSKWVLISK